MDRVGCTGVVEPPRLVCHADAPSNIADDVELDAGSITRICFHKDDVMIPRPRDVGVCHADSELCQVHSMVLG